MELYFWKINLFGVSQTYVEILPLFWRTEIYALTKWKTNLELLKKEGVKVSI